MAESFHSLLFASSMVNLVQNGEGIVFSVFPFVLFFPAKRQMVNKAS